MYPSHLVLIDPLKNIALKRQQYVGEFIGSLQSALGTKFDFEYWYHPKTVGTQSPRGPSKTLEEMLRAFVPSTFGKVSCSLFVGSEVGEAPILSPELSRETTEKIIQDQAKDASAL
ncbi:hypothetical protein Tco_1123049 [Tanacetum coccineum]|uniref:Uncharacterized protein n=1 Tax=Tanacetum coccineum TaxID=301880 RepID=A0ABQ5J2J0_9ASTR